MDLDLLGPTVFRHRNVDQFHFQLPAPSAHVSLVSFSGEHASDDDDDGGGGDGV